MPRDIQALIQRLQAKSHTRKATNQHNQPERTLASLFDTDKREHQRRCGRHEADAAQEHQGADDLPPDGMVHNLLGLGRGEARAGPGRAGLELGSLPRHAGEDQGLGGNPDHDQRQQQNQEKRSDSNHAPALLER
jgi:hypothetical protein